MTNKIVDHRVLDGHVHVTLYENGEVDIERPPEVQGGRWHTIKLTDLEVFGLMSWLSGVKLPKSQNEAVN